MAISSEGSTCFQDASVMIRTCTYLYLHSNKPQTMSQKQCPTGIRLGTPLQGSDHGYACGSNKMLSLLFKCRRCRSIVDRLTP